MKFNFYLTKFIILLLLINSGACNSRKKELQKIINIWQGKELVFPDLKAKIDGRDTVWNEWKNKKYKLIHYIDTSGCTSCQLHLYDWNIFIDEAAKTMPNLVVVFVVSLPNINEFDKLAKINSFSWPILYDPLGNFNFLNNLPHDSLLKTFLLDSQNRIIILGNPIKNSSVKRLLEDIVKGNI